MADGAAVDAAEARTGFAERYDWMERCLAWPVAAEVGLFSEVGLAAEVARFVAEVAPGSGVRHAALRLPWPLDIWLRHRLRHRLHLCFAAEGRTSRFFSTHTCAMFRFNRNRMQMS